MLVAAALDLGVGLDYLQAELATLPLPANSFALALNRVERCTIAASKFDVELLPDADGAATEPAHIEIGRAHV